MAGEVGADWYLDMTITPLSCMLDMTPSESHPAFHVSIRRVSVRTEVSLADALVQLGSKELRHVCDRLLTCSAARRVYGHRPILCGEVVQARPEKFTTETDAKLA